MRRIVSAAVLAVAALAVLAVSAIGQVPAKVNYQVMLTNNADEPLADTAVSLVFRLYGYEVGGGELWHETHNTSTNSVGVVTVLLGDSVTLSSALFDGPLWLQVEVEGQILLPRRELVAAPYALYANDSSMLGNELAEDYVLDSDLAIGGVINTPSNPVDWTQLKNVPAGFADGGDAEGGAGDGHSLDADDGSPVDAVYVDADGNVGIGVTTPANKLVVGPNGSGLSYAQFANPTTGFGSTDGFRVGTSGNSAFIGQNENASITFLTNGSVRHRIEADGTLTIGGVTSNGTAHIYADGPADPVISLYSHESFGGNISLFDETGDYHTSLEADFDGTGGFFMVDGGSGAEAFVVDGSYSGGDPLVAISGGSSSTHFNTFNTGDGAVDLPFSAVSSVEMQNEPGVNYSTSATSLALDGSLQTMLSRSIYCPSNGYVLAIGTANASIDHVNGTNSGSNFGVSSSGASYPAGGQLYCRLPNTAPTGNYHQIITTQWIFQTSAGSQTFYFLADRVVGDWTVFGRNLSLVFFPTYYGVLTEPALLVPPSGVDMPTAEPAVPITEADIAAERAACEAANDARIAQELAEMEARIEEIRAQMGNGNDQ